MLDSYIGGLPAFIHGFVASQTARFTIPDLICAGDSDCPLVRCTRNAHRRCAAVAVPGRVSYMFVRTAAAVPLPWCVQGFACAGRQCVESATYYHDAVEPALQFDYDALVWNSLSGSAAQRNDIAPVWAESK